MLTKPDITGHAPVMDRILTPKQAADTARVGRTTIMRALEKSAIPGARRGNDGRWQIPEPGLQDWLSHRPDRVVTVRSDDGFRPEMPTPEEVVTLRTDLATARAEISGLKDRLNDRDREVERLDAALHAALAPRPSLFERLLFRRSS